MTSTVDSFQSSHWFAVPRPIRNLFNHFPLHVYGPEDLPVRSPASVRQRPALYVFIAQDDALVGRPSYNPSCLKWQTMLRIAGIKFDIVPSNNHASPSGALPFLLLSSSQAPKPLTGEKIYKYIREHAVLELSNISSPRLEAYQALLTQNIRPAWLYALYLLPANARLLKSLYLPSSILLRVPLHQTLHAAATAEILKTTRRATISPSQIFSAATTALRALSSLLGEDKWFFGADGPGLFDADVFAYTYLIDGNALAWEDKSLNSCFEGLDNLRRHRERLYNKCWGSDES
ncbi:mitochondrial outer membrane (Sam35) [Fusarium beomiforme]|uniref:Mitochondrial outer membrane (Sam35) n=1 Tax=Fusarium beomiforme TaxID=44412 RepID=A0A9P5A5H7_9HYPO|nr:mitochondrial outer membrane (Sam35) [Fusarium beomiforme]